MKKKFTKWIALMLILCLTVTAMPIYAFAESGLAEPTENQSLEEEKVIKENKTVEILAEEETLREENVKHFINSDGSYTAISYSNPVHYKEEGKDEWIEIDNTLVESKTYARGEETVSYAPKSSPLDVRLNETGENTYVSLREGEYEISWHYEMDKKGKSEKKEIKEADKNQEKINVKTLSGRTYKGEGTNVDLEVILDSNRIKENLILHDKNVKTKYSIVYEIGELMPIQEDDKTIGLFAPNDKKVFTITAPMMEDANKEVSSKLSLKIESFKDGVLRVNLEIDKEWLRDDNRAFPVIVDPYVFEETNTTAGDASSYYLPQNAYPYGTLGVGNDANSATGKVRSFVKFTLPNLKAGDMVTEAYFGICQCAGYYGYSHVGNPSLQVNLHKVTSAWTESSIRNSSGFSHNPSIEDGVADYQNIGQRSTPGYVTFNASRIVKEWYEGDSPNYGICLKADDEEAWALANFVATDASDIDARPYLQIIYLNNKGLEDRWTYHETDMGESGTGYINDYTGNLVYELPITSTSGLRLPVSVSMIYNGYQIRTHFDEEASVGLGWRLNIQQRLKEISNSGTSLEQKLYASGYRYIYEDSDGTSHYFKLKEGSSGEYIDEEGLNLKLTKVYDEDTYEETREFYKLESKDGSYLTFNWSGYVVKGYDNDGNSYKIGYSGTALRYIKDGAGNVIWFEIDTNGYVTKIIDPLGREYVISYTSGLPSVVTYPDGVSTLLRYSSYRLTKVRGRDKVWIKYDYSDTGDESKKNRVIGVGEYSSLSSSSCEEEYIGKSISIEYGKNKTIFTDDKGDKTSYIFDNYGRTKNVIASNGAAQNLGYINPSNSNSNNSKLAHLVESSSSVSGYVRNMIFNHSFELDIPSRFSCVNASANTANVYLGKRSVQINEGGMITQIVSGADTGSYTFSAYAKTNLQGKPKLKIECLDASGNILLAKTSRNVDRSLFWERLHVSITSPSETAMVRVRCINEGTSPVYFDCLQVEAGLELNQYNMVVNGSFDNSLDGTWIGKGTMSSDTRVAAIDDERSTYACKITGEGSKDKYFSQAIEINRPAKNLFFKVSMLGKGSSVNLQEDTRKFGMVVTSYFTDGTYKEDTINFNPDYVSGWQRLADTIGYDDGYESKTVEYITVRMAYCKNENMAYFDDILVQIDETGMSYDYDSDGNLISAIETSGRQKSYTYSNAGEILSATNEDNKKYQYTYDTSNPHRLLSAVSKSSNLKFSFGYGSYGNVTSQTVQAVNSQGTNIGEYIRTNTTYTSNGNYIASEIDDRGKSYIYEYNQSKGLLDSATDKNGNVTYYDYNTSNDYLTSLSDKENETDVDATTVDYEYNSKLQLTDINTNSTNYTFIYDDFGNVLTTKAGNVLLNTNTYEERNGNLLASTYGNNFIKEYMYDKYDRLTSVKYMGEEKYAYSYNAEGLLSRYIDRENGKTYQYTYDLIGRPIRVDVSDGSYIENTFDNMNMSTKTTYRVGSKVMDVRYGYSDKDNLPESVSFNGKTVTNTYDGLTRLTSKAYSLGNEGNLGNVAYSYLDHESDEGRTTGVVGSISYFGAGTDLSLGTRYYDYDSQGNILREYRYSKDETGLRESYEYDSKNQLVRHDSKTQNKTFTYSYDKAGNILSKTTYNYTTSETLGTPIDTVSYQYQSNDGWGDKLTSYDGKVITYDEIGNMTSFDGKTYSWQGRELTGITTAIDTYSYKYNAEGIRTEKIVNGITTKYFLNGSQVVAETTDGNTIWFIYDSQGSRVALVENGQTFYYMYNLQGDVIGLVDETTGEVVATYEYDAWGRCILVQNKEGYTVGTDNPFRYRGYYYDEETELYYLNTRYYSPEFGRFINADGIIDNRGLITQNLFAYCGNNPVNNQDDSGHLFVGAIVGGIVGGLFGGLSALIQGESVKVGIVTGAATGALVGFICDAVTTAGLAPVIGVLAVGIISAVGDWSKQVMNNYSKNTSLQKRGSDIGMNNDIKDFGNAISQSIVDVNYNEVARAAVVGMAFAPMAYGTNKIITSAFSGLENNFVNKAAEYIASGFVEFNNSSIQFIVDLF